MVAGLSVPYSRQAAFASVRYSSVLQFEDHWLSGCVKNQRLYEQTNSLYEYLYNVNGLNCGSHVLPMRLGGWCLTYRAEQSMMLNHYTARDLFGFLCAVVPPALWLSAPSSSLSFRNSLAFVFTTVFLLPKQLSTKVCNPKIGTREKHAR